MSNIKEAIDFAIRILEEYDNRWDVNPNLKSGTQMAIQDLRAAAAELDAFAATLTGFSVRCDCGADTEWMDTGWVCDKCNTEVRVMSNVLAEDLDAQRGAA